MFKNIIYKATVLTVIAVSACSCNKYLALRPQNGITGDNFWQTKEQLQAAVIAVYSDLETGSGGKAPAEVFFTWGEVRADFVQAGTGISADEQSIINGNILPTTSNTALLAWQPMYQVINLCNNILDYGPGVLSVDNTLTQTQLNSYLGEILTLRALAYFYLVRSWGDVPLKLHSTATDADVVQIAKSPAKDVLTQIVADLKLAETYAPAAYADRASDRGRVNKFTVNALQADVYLWMDDFADAITACDKVINSGKYGLVPGDTQSNWFNTLFATGNSIEGIFEIQFDQAFATSNGSPYYSLFSPPPLKAQFRADPNIVDNFYTTDPLIVTNVDFRGLEVAIHVADQTIYKLVTTSFTNVAANTNSLFPHWIVYRYADVLLMKAEACINTTGRGQDALDIINQIRTRAHALPTSAQGPSANDVAGLTNYLMAERAREFAFEGKRWYDLLRNAKRNNFARLDLLQAAVQESTPALYQQSMLAKIKDPNFLYFPVPKNDIQNDPNLVQNPFYK